MPTYEYQCTSNGRVVEVRHKMDERLNTWGEVCERAGIAPGMTDPRAPVEKLISAGYIGSAGTAGPTPGEAGCGAPACGSGACGGGFCGLQ